MEHLSSKNIAGNMDGGLDARRSACRRWSSGVGHRDSIPDRDAATGSTVPGMSVKEWTVQEAKHSMTATVTAREYRRLPWETEKECPIRQAVELQGGQVFSVRNSRKLDVEDMPDLIIVLPPYVALLELESRGAT